MIVIDTGPLVALCDARDGKHRLAVRQRQTLSGDQFIAAAEYGAAGVGPNGTTIPLAT